MVGLSSKTLSIFQNIQVSLEYLRNTLYERENSSITVFAVMNSLLLYKNTIYRALSKKRYDRVMEFVPRAINAYCIFFDTPKQCVRQYDRKMILDSLDIDPTVSYFDRAIDLIRSIQEKKS